MRLLKRNDNDELSLTKDLLGNDIIPSYAILSHTWLDDEVTFEDWNRGHAESKAGYEKIRFCAQQAERDGLCYFWVDTCCINKADPVELQDAINSMFRWYQNAAKCYVYLSDVSTTKRKANSEDSEFAWEPAFRASRWFTRGWTLQELLAPRHVGFYSQKGDHLGNKQDLETQIHEVTGIATSALRYESLQSFTVDERFSWAKSRQTTRKEDKAYCLLGLFGVFMPLLYGEGEDNAFKRLREEIDKASESLNRRQSSEPLQKEDQECIKSLRLTDPRLDKIRIEETKGGLLENVCDWVFDHHDFQQWQTSKKSELLWIKGDPGKGKTMLLCGIIDELNKSTGETLAYFFCQATDSRINNALAVLRGLLYMLLSQQPSLISHVRKKYDEADKSLFEDVNAWVALKDIFVEVLRDPSLSATYVIIDAMDECVVDLPKLLKFVAEQSSASSRVKWIVSSRNEPDIEERLEQAGHKIRLSLELNAESVSTAVRSYIEQQVSRLAQQKGYDESTRGAVLKHLTTNADDTFLWVSLVCRNLQETSKRIVLKKLASFPPGLDSLYKQMMEKINKLEDDAELCKNVLATVTIVYRPITLLELATLIEELETADEDSIREVVGLCGSFLTLREKTIYFVHQSATDFLLDNGAEDVFTHGKEFVHYNIFDRSVQKLSQTLHRDMYNLRKPGYAIEGIKQPDPDPLAASRYSCIYWTDHLCDAHVMSSERHAQETRSILDLFLRKKYLYWLEAISLCRSMAKGIVSMMNLHSITYVRLKQEISIR